MCQREARRAEKAQEAAARTQEDPPIMENQMEKKMENEMETGGIWGFKGFDLSGILASHIVSFKLIP